MQLVLPGLDLLDAALPALHRLEAVSHVVGGGLQHLANVPAYLGDGQGGDAQHVLGGHQALKPLIRIHNLGFPVGKQLHGQLHQQAAEGQQQQCGSQVEHRVHVGDLGHRVIRGQRDHPVRKRRHQTEGDEQHCADDVEHQVDHGGPLGVAVRSHGGQKCRDTGSDVLAEQHEHRAVQSDYPAHGQGL